MMDTPSLSHLQERSEHFLNLTGRRPRILLIHLEKKKLKKGKKASQKVKQSSQDDKNISQNRLKSLAVVFADSGFDVDIGPAFSTHAAITKMACENDVHVIGICPAGFEQTSSERIGFLKGLKKEILEKCGKSIKVITENVTFEEDLAANPVELEKRFAHSVLKTLELIGG